MAADLSYQRPIEEAVCPDRGSLAPEPGSCGQGLAGPLNYAQVNKSLFIPIHLRPPLQALEDCFGCEISCVPVCMRVCACA